MKKILINIIAVCFLFSSVYAGAEYNISETAISNVPLYTTVEEFSARLSSFGSGEVVVRSNDSAYDTAVWKKTFVDEKCFFKSDGKYYAIETIDSLYTEELSAGRGFNITELKNTGENIALSFFIRPGKSFYLQTVSFQTGGGKRISFETGHDGFASVTDSEGNKTRICRIGNEKPQLVELVCKNDSQTLSLMYMFINGEKIELENSVQITLGTNLSVVYTSENRSYKLTELTAMAVGGYQTQYNAPEPILIGEDSTLYDNYGINNIDAVYLNNNSVDSMDTVFGGEMQIEGQKLIVNNIFSGDSYECEILEKKPQLSKVQLFKNDNEIFAIESGTLTVKREIPSGNTIFIALYTNGGVLKKVSMEKQAVLNCDEDDIIKVFVLDSKNTLNPVTLMAEITGEGIFHNDGYEK